MSQRRRNEQTKIVALQAEFERLKGDGPRSRTSRNVLVSHAAWANPLRLICLEAFQAHRFLKTYRNKTDKNDARDLAQLVRMGGEFIRPVTVRARRPGGSDAVRLLDGTLYYAAAAAKTLRASPSRVQAPSAQNARKLPPSEGRQFSCVLVPSEGAFRLPPHAPRRPHPVELSAEDQAALDVAQGEFDRLTEQHQTAEELPDEVDARFGELGVKVEQLEAKRQAYDPVMSRAAALSSSSIMTAPSGSNAVSSALRMTNPAMRPGWTATAKHQMRRVKGTMQPCATVIGSPRIV
ncbi:hypothetical protein [Bradyrhizobium sp. CCGB12]|uniref:hypothetical protein n=1 Tax=Bradyrhizobium sp. CCGB12 TaxID=2949632 RepID=UPI0035BF33CE